MRMTDESPTDAMKFRRFARDCIRIAEQIVSADDQAALLTMAQEWIRLADQEHRPH